MAAGLVDAVRQITGVDADVLQPLSNRGLSPEALAGEVRARVQGPRLVFTDLLSGSCSFAVRRHCHDLQELVVVSGVNLPMLLEFAMFRELPVAELVPRLLSKGRSAIGSSGFNTEQNEHRVVSSG